MQPTKRLISLIRTTGTRLVILAAILMTVLASNITPAAAAPTRVLVSVTVGAQSGTLTAGTTGNATFVASVLRSGTSPNNFVLSVSGLPAGASVIAQSPSNPLNFFGGNNPRNVTLTIQVNASVPAGSYNFNVQASGTGPDPIGVGTLTVGAAGPVAQTITFGPLANKAFGDPNFNVSATASSGLAVSFAAGGNCTVVGTLVSLTGAGSCTITASQAGNASYLPAADVQQTFTINQGVPAITFATSPLVEFPGSDFNASATTNSDGALTYSYVSGPCSLVDGNAGTFSSSGVGTCVVQVDTAVSTNFVAGSAQQAITIYPPFIHLYAVAGSTTLGIQSVTVWGYNSSNTPVTQPGGPTIEVNEGDTVIVVLHNELGVDTGLLFQGQDMIPDVTGVATGGTKLYSFTANRPGTYLYGAGLLAGAQYQSAMGLYGALIVRPAAPGQAYNAAATAYDDEAVLVLSEIDTNLNNSANPSAFDMRNFKPRYFLINGQAYPNTTETVTGAGNRVLLRYLNAGMQFHSMAILGTTQTVIADDGSPLAYPHSMVAETFGPGQTIDTIVTIPAAAADGNRFAIYDGNLMLRNSNQAGFGGMLTFLAVSGTPPVGDTTGPATSNVTYGAGTLSATVSDVATGNSNIVAAEYFMDSIGAAGTGSGMSGAFVSPVESVTASVVVPSGSHTLYVHGQDSAGNWGAFSSVLVNGGDTTGPATTGLTLTPNPSNGTVNMALSATGNDSASGGSTIAAAEYTIDGGTAVSMVVNLPATIASLDASIPAATINALPEGTHIVAVRSQDAAGNWGTAVTINLIVDKSGPVTSNAMASPNPSNGQIGYSSLTQAVRVTATVADTSAKISVVEGFIDTVGANGTGFFFAASDGSFNSLSETSFADIPLTTIIQLSNGNHTLYVHGKDAAGNWGATSSTILVVDKIAPAISSITTLDANPTTAASVQFLVAFSESVTGVTSSNFALVSGGSVTGASITSVTGSGATRTITVATGSGSGTLGLNLATATGIKDLAGNALPTTGLPLVGQVYTIPSLIQLYFSTADNFAVPGVGGTPDDADIYTWSGGGSFGRLFDGSVAGLAGSADIDAFTVVDADTFYMSFTGFTAVPGLGSVAGEDIVLYDAGAWSLYFDGSDVDLSGNAENVDAFEILSDGSILVSTAGTPSVTGLSGLASQDLLQCVGTFGPTTTCTWSLYFDGSDVALSSGSENVDGVAVSAGNIFLSTSGAFTVTGLSGQGEDLFICNAPTVGINTACTSFSMFFDGSVVGMTNNLDAFDLP